MDVIDVQVSDKDGYKSRSNTVKASRQDRERVKLEARFSFRPARLCFSLWLKTLENNFMQWLVVNTLFQGKMDHHNQEDGSRGNTKIGPVLEVTTSCLHGKHGVEIRIWSLSGDNTQDQPEEQALQLNVKGFACRSKAKAKPQRREPAAYSPKIIPMNARNWIDIEPGKSFSLCVRGFEESNPSSSTFSTSTTRRGWSSSFLEN